MHTREVPEPQAAPDELLIRVHAVEVTKADCELRSLRFPVMWFAPFLRLALGWKAPRRKIPGMYFAGTVEATGVKVTKFQPGQRIFGSAQLRQGACAEYLCLPERFTLAPVPENVSLEEAAVVPLGGLNALHFMRRANIRPGESMLINGAGGSIGLFALQIARAAGAQVSVVDAASKAPLLLQLGAEKFLDYGKGELDRHTDSYDIIFDMVASSSHAQLLGMLKPGGRYLTANPNLRKMLRSLFVGLFSTKKSIFAFAAEKEEELLELKAMIEAGQIRPVLDQVFSMEEATLAHRRVETEARLGGVAIAIA